MHPTDLVSVVVTTYNRSDALLAVLGGLALQTDGNFEVIVADDGSTELHQARVLRSAVAAQLKLVYVWQPDVGFTAARNRNRGVGAAQGAYLVFLDGDCVPERDFVAQHRRLAARACFVNGSRVLLSPALSQRVLSGQEQIVGRALAYWVRQRLAGNASKLGGCLRLPDWRLRLQQGFVWKGIRSCNMGVWRDDFERINGFDESFVGWGHEDADFVLRLHHAGVQRKNGFCATEVFHLWHREAARQAESDNARRVRERMALPVTQAEIGMAQTRLREDGVITRLG